MPGICPIHGHATAQLTPCQLSPHVCPSYSPSPASVLFLSYSAYFSSPLLVKTCGVAFHPTLSEVCLSLPLILNLLTGSCCKRNCSWNLLLFVQESQNLWVLPLPSFLSTALPSRHFASFHHSGHFAISSIGKHLEHHLYFLFFYYYYFLILFLLYFTLQYCIGFAIH